jgi:hypothetical protein
VVNNAAKVEVVNLSTFKSAGTITGITNPRYFMGVSATKGYITEWGASAGSVKVVDLLTNTVTKTILTNSGPNKMVKVGDRVYVACSGGYAKDSIVTVIDLTGDSVLTSIEVGSCPSDVQVDANGKIWVLCSGTSYVNATTNSYPTLQEKGSLVRIDAATNTVDFSIAFNSTSSQPSDLVINNAKTTLYYSYDSKVYSQNSTSNSLTTTAIIDRDFYGLGIDPSNDYFYGADAGDYVSNGKVFRYNAAATLLDSIVVGVIPSGFKF